ncbi:phage tail protein [Maritimibacter sp. 55A14]|uniref:head-tail adaptor protein n=1 Tax=Maritimibacter sp. 55A14 TaxID=2174844 RepID=UPI000D6130EC|nr:head-tail adaptor protein [Maritimibacter sp. 55A14]PWE30648.1 phage tail protein [Maritimibacter sp. 55A14]
MRPVRLNRKLVLEEAQGLLDGAGGFTEMWVPLGTIWADLRPRTGRERGDGALNVSDMAWRIIVRAAPHGAPSRPRPDQRLRDGGRVFRIEAVAEEGSDGRYLICFASEEAGA